MRSKTRIPVAFFFLLQLFSSSIPAQTPAIDCQRSAHPLTELGDLFIRGKTLALTDYPYTVESAGARYLRIRIQVANPKVCDWYLTIRDKEFKLIQTLSREDFHDSDSLWTVRIYQSAVFLDLESCPDAAASPVVTVQEYLAMPPKTDKNPFYSTQASIAAWKELYKGDEKHKSWGDFVGILIGSWNRVSWTCSGVMVARDLFLTNWHCGAPRFTGGDDPNTPAKPFPEAGYWDEFIVRDILVDTSWDTDLLSRDFVVVRDGVLAQSSELDFAILEVKPITSAGKVRPVQISLTPISQKDQLWIIQHPLALQKRISSCEVINPETQGWHATSGLVDFTHQCDTEGGSSGAPVFNSKGQLVGIHHKGFELDAKDCKPLLPKVNKAVRIDKIMSYLFEKHRSVYDRILKNRL